MQRSRQYNWQDPQALAATARSMSGIEFLQAIFEGILAPPPIMATLGFEPAAKAEPGRVVFTCTPGEHHYNPIGVVHGGLHATLLDSAAGCAVHSTLPAGMGYTSLDLSIKFLRPVSTQTGVVRAVGTVLNKGRRTALAQAELFDANDNLLAHATSSCLLFEL